MGARINGISGVCTEVACPEKAGVGGSIPSLATILQLLTGTVDPVLFHFVPNPNSACRSLSHRIEEQTAPPVSCSLPKGISEVPVKPSFIALARE